MHTQEHKNFSAHHNVSTTEHTRTHNRHVHSRAHTRIHSLTIRAHNHNIAVEIERRFTCETVMHTHSHEQKRERIQHAREHKSELMMVCSVLESNNISRMEKGKREREPDLTCNRVNTFMTLGMGHGVAHGDLNEMNPLQ